MILFQGFQTISSQLDWLPFILLLWRGVAMVVKVELKEGRFLLLFHRSGNWEDALVDPLSIHSTLPQFGLKSFPCVLQVPPYPLLSKLGLGQMAHLLSYKRALSPKKIWLTCFSWGRSSFWQNTQQKLEECILHVLTNLLSHRTTLQKEVKIVSSFFLEYWVMSMKTCNVVSW